MSARTMHLMVGMARGLAETSQAELLGYAAGGFEPGESLDDVAQVSRPGDRQMALPQPAVV